MNMPINDAPAGNANADNTVPLFLFQTVARRRRAAEAADTGEQVQAAVTSYITYFAEYSAEYTPPACSCE